MPSSSPVRRLVFASVLAAGVVAQLAVAGPASAVTADRIELKGGELRVEGQAAPNQFVIVESTTSLAGGRADVDGSYKLQDTGFTAPDCQLTIRDGFTPTVTVTIPGCTPVVVPVQGVAAGI
jgi:hypothetical protein